MHRTLTAGAARLRSRARRALDPQARERGYSTLELVVLLPLLFFILIAIVQIALYCSAANAAQTAAAQALAAVKAQGGTAVEGQAQAQATLAQMTGTTLKDTAVYVANDGATANVTVTGQAIAVGPYTLHITAIAQGPVERLVQK